MKILMLITACLILFLFNSYAYSQEANSPRESEINLCGNGLTSVPSEIFTMEGITMLNLSNNALTELPDEIKKLKNLRVLDLRGNNISELPFELRRLKFLKEIYLDYDYWHSKLDAVKEVTRARIILK